ncbi:MAG: tRNA (cytidine(34)-2'-O)-methyltransferase [Magnetococcus sp. MYC-9]
MEPLFHIILYQPEIPPNTGNILRLCAASGAVLHLVGPLGFRLDAPAVRRAGMDYRLWASVQRWNDWQSYWQSHPPQARLFPVTTRGRRSHASWRYQSGDRFLFGSEGSGLPDAIRSAHQERLIRIPMVEEARSLNLANSVGIILYEALRQVGFPGLMSGEM